MECPKCRDYRENKVYIRKTFKTYPELLLIKIDRINDKGRVNQARMKLTDKIIMFDKIQNLANPLGQEEVKYELIAYIDMQGKTLEKCFYKPIIKMNED